MAVDWLSVWCSSIGNTNCCSLECSPSLDPLKSETLTFTAESCTKVRSLLVTVLLDGQNSVQCSCSLLSFKAGEIGKREVCELWRAFRQMVSGMVKGRLSNCALSQTDQILNLGIQTCLWFALRMGVSPVRSFGVPSVRFRCVPLRSFGAPSVRFRCVPLSNCRCLQCNVSVCPPFEISMSPV